MMLLSNSFRLGGERIIEINGINGKDDGPTAQNSGTGRISGPRGTTGSVSDASQTSEELEPEPDVVVLTTRGSTPVPERRRLLISGGN